jgi:hypothetical protein
VQSNRLILILIVVLHCFLITPLFKVGLSWLNYYLLFLFLVSGVHFARLIIKSKSNYSETSENHLKKIDYIFSLILLIITALISKRYINEYTVWLDENDAAVSSLLDDVVTNAANYQQPPLDYLYRRLGLIFVGFNEVGLRLASVIAYILFISVSYFNFLKISKNSYLAFLFSLFLAFNDWIIRYAIEARPYLLGLFYFSLFAYFVISQIQDEDFEDPKTLKNIFRHSQVAFVTFFWLMSISMQPFFFICSTIVIGGVYALITKNTKIKNIVFQMGLGLLLFIPFQFKIVGSSLKYLKNPSVQVDNVFVQNLNQSFEVLLDLFTRNPGLTGLFIVSLTIILLGLTSTPKKKIVILSAILVVSYTLILNGFFALKINWPMNHRYLLLNLTLFYYLVFISIHYYKENSAQLIKISALVLCAFVSLGTNYKYSLNDIRQTDWRHLYQLMNSKVQVKAVAYIYAFYPAAHEGIDGFFMASSFYPTPKIELRSVRASSYLNNSEYINYYEKNETLEAFIAIDKMTIEPEIFWKLKIDGTELLDTQSFFVVYKKSGLPIRSVVEQLLDQLDVLIPPSENKFRLHLDLFDLKILSLGCARAKILLNHLESYKINDLELTLRQQKFSETCP